MVSFPSIPVFEPWDAPAVAEFMRPLVEPWFKEQAWVHIVDPQERLVESNFENGITTVLVEPIWSGWARIKPLRTALNSKQPYNATTTRVVQFWIEFPKDQEEPDLRAGLEIAVADGVNDPALTRHQFVISGAINGSDAWQRTIETVVNFESRPNYNMTDWPKPTDADIPQVGFGSGGFGVNPFGD